MVYSVDETLDIGEDRGTPIIEDYAVRMPFKFDGKIEGLRLSCGLKFREVGRCRDLVGLWSLFRAFFAVSWRVRPKACAHRSIWKRRGGEEAGT